MDASKLISEQLLKNSLTTLSPLTKLVPVNALYFYLNINPIVVNSISVEEEIKGPIPIYYVIKVLSMV